jgi:hypothetical protein
MMSDPQVLQVIYLAIVSYFAAKRQEKQAASAHDSRATSADEPRIMHGSSGFSEGERSPDLRQAPARR